MWKTKNNNHDGAAILKENRMKKTNGLTIRKHCVNLSAVWRRMARNEIHMAIVSNLESLSFHSSTQMCEIHRCVQ